MKKILINKKKCIGCGLCVTLAPCTFKLGKKGKAEVINSSGDSDKKIKEAIISCPVDAIS